MFKPHYFVEPFLNSQQLHSKCSMCGCMRSNAIHTLPSPIKTNSQEMGKKLLEYLRVSDINRDEFIDALSMCVDSDTWIFAVDSIRDFKN